MSHGEPRRREKFWNEGGHSEQWKRGSELSTREEEHEPGLRRQDTEGTDWEESGCQTRESGPFRRERGGTEAVWAAGP